MTLEQLEYVCEVASAGTIIAAAQNCNLAHTTLSRAIANLEAELGFVIFDRSRKGCELTPMGSDVLRLAKEILETKEKIKQLGQTDTPDYLRIGAYPIAAENFFKQPLTEFNAACPGTDIFINHYGVSDIIEAVGKHELDFGLVYFLPEQMGTINNTVKVTELLESDLVVVCNPRSRLARMDKVTPFDLRNETFLLQNEEQILYMMKHVFFPEKMPKIAMRSNNNDLIKTGIAAGNAIATYLETVIANDPMVKSGELCYRPIYVNDKPYRLKYLYIRPKQKPMPASERTFIRLLKKAIT